MDPEVYILVGMVALFAVVGGVIGADQLRRHRWRTEGRGNTDRLIRTGATATATVTDERLARRRNPGDRSAVLQLTLEFTDSHGQLRHASPVVEVDAVLAAQFTAGSEIGVLYDLDDVSDLVVDPRVTQTRIPD